MKPKVKRRIKIALFSVTAILVLLGVGFYMYTQDYYLADASAIEVFSGAEAGTDHRIEKRDDMWIFHPDTENNREIGFIFYPGGKVEETAYSLLLRELSQNGITCVLVQMPFNLAVFDVNAADDVYAELPEIKKWLIGGHSLGGAMASSYAKDNSDVVSGLVLLGAYPVENTVMPTLAVYGSEDLVLDQTKLASTQNKYEIEGGNHAYFGHYGEQKGDGEATITREQQQQVTVEKVTAFIMDLNK